MPDINPSLPVVGSPNSTEEPKVVTAFQALIAAVNDIDSANVLDNSLTGGDVQDLSIATADLADLAVTTAKLAANAVTAAKMETQQALQTLSLSPPGWTGTPDGFLRYFKDSLGVVRSQPHVLVVGAGSVAGGTLLGTLPAGYRPGHKLYFPFLELTGASVSTPQYITVDTNGDIKVVGADGGSIGAGASVVFYFQYHAES